MAKSLLDTLIEQGIDPVIAASLVKSAEKQANKGGSTGPKKSSRGAFFAGQAAEKPKKYNGIHTYTAVCATCGSRTQKRRVAQIDPNKPLPEVVPVSICESCIPFYRTLDQDALISLILIKDHEDITLRLMSHKEQIALARKLSPFDILARKFEQEVDAPYEKEETVIKREKTKK